MWLKKEKFAKTGFVILDYANDNNASRRIKTYRNGLKTPKFHQMLHGCDYIKRHGSPLNYDSSRGENFGKVKIKDNAKFDKIIERCHQFQCWL